MPIEVIKPARKGMILAIQTQRWITIPWRRDFEEWCMCSHATSM